MIPIDIVGLILKGDDQGLYVKILDDGANTGGYLIITSPSISFDEGYDDWVENFSDLEKYFGESNWEIEWLKE